MDDDAIASQSTELLRRRQHSSPMFTSINHLLLILIRLTMLFMGMCLLVWFVSQLISWLSPPAKQTGWERVWYSLLD